MAAILSDQDIKKLIGSVIIEGDETSIRPNSYVIRLGNCGEFLNASKEFQIGQVKKGIRVPPGHSVALTAFETIDFRRETINKVFSDCDLLGLITPTTDMSREGIVAPTTLVDPGYHGTLNWTITNTSNEERKFLFKEKIFRLTIHKLEKGERPENIYNGDYQNKIGYVRSLRKGPPVGMKETEWEDSQVEGGPESLLENLMRSGYPWHVLGSRLKMIDQQFKSVSEEYSEIFTSIEDLKKQVVNISKSSSSITEQIRTILKEEVSSLQSRWALISFSIMGTLLGLGLTITGNDLVIQFFKKNASLLGFALILICIILIVFLFRRKR
jgi:deoxycytidine triphosphate deaminase